MSNKLSQKGIMMQPQVGGNQHTKQQFEKTSTLNNITKGEYQMTQPRVPGNSVHL